MKVPALVYCPQDNRPCAIGGRCAACPSRTQQRIAEVTQELVGLFANVDDGERALAVREFCRALLDGFDVDGMGGCRLCCS